MRISCLEKRCLIARFSTEVRMRAIVHVHFPARAAIVPADKRSSNLHSGRLLWSFVHVAVYFRLFRERYSPASPQRKTAHPLLPLTLGTVL